MNFVTIFFRVLIDSSSSRSRIVISSVFGMSTSHRYVRSKTITMSESGSDEYFGVVVLNGTLLARTRGSFLVQP